MDLVAAIEITAGAISRAEDRRERLKLYLLASKLHDLYIPPEEARETVEAMTKDELRPSQLKALHDRVVRNGPEIQRLLNQLSLLCKTKGRTLFTSSELAAISEATDLKRGLRVEMLELFRAYRVRQYAIFYPYITPTPDEVLEWSLPEYTAETVENIKADTRVISDAKALLKRVEKLSLVLDTAFEALAEPSNRSAQHKLGLFQVAIIAGAGVSLWFLGAVSSELLQPFINSIALWVRHILNLH